jgi:hypothetical protein
MVMFEFTVLSQRCSEWIWAFAFRMLPFRLFSSSFFFGEHWQRSMGHVRLSMRQQRSGSGCM